MKPLRRHGRNTTNTRTNNKSQSLGEAIGPNWGVAAFEPVSSWLSRIESSFAVIQLQSGPRETSRPAASQFLRFYQRSAHSHEEIPRLAIDVKEWREHFPAVWRFSAEVA